MTGMPVERIQTRIRYCHRLGFAAKNHLHASIRVEFDDCVDIDRRPDVVLRIDTHLLRLQEAINARPNSRTNLPERSNCKRRPPPCDTARDVANRDRRIPVRV